MHQDFKLYDGVVYWIVRMGRALQQEMKAQLGKIDLNVRSIAVLTAVDSGRAQTPSGIARYLGVDRAVVTRTLRDLQDRGWVRLARNTADGRSHHVALTEAGKNKLAQGAACARAVNEAFAAKLPPGHADDIRLRFRDLVEHNDAAGVRPPIFDE